MNKYKEAARFGLRVSTPKGLLSVEQLWHISLDDLDETLVELDKRLTTENKKTFLKKQDNESKENAVQLCFDVAHDILTTRMEEREIEQAERSKRIHNQKILSIIKEKRDEVLHTSTIEELEKLLKE